MPNRVQLHFAPPVCAWLNNPFTGRCVTRREPTQWPLRSPDFTSCNLFLWGRAI